MYAMTVPPFLFRRKLVALRPDLRLGSKLSRAWFCLPPDFKVDEITIDDVFIHTPTRAHNVADNTQDQQRAHVDAAAHFRGRTAGQGFFAPLQQLHAPADGSTRCPAHHCAVGDTWSMSLLKCNCSSHLIVRLHLPLNIRLPSPTGFIKHRDRETKRGEFIFYSDRIIRLLVEEALNHLAVKPKTVVTPTGAEYNGVAFCGKIAGVSSEQKIPITKTAL